MSLHNEVEMTCPECGHTKKVSWAASLNAERHPALRDAIMDGSFQAETCSACGTKLRLPSHMSYLDMNRGHWILAEDIPELAHCFEHEAKAKALFEEAFGAKAPEPARAMADGLEPRLVFGWQALREKLICTELSLEDVTVELMKLAMLRGVDGAQIGGNIALRLVSGDEETLQFNITDNESEEIISGTEAPRALYDDIVGDEKSWKPFREQLTGKVFVDIARLMIEV